MTQRTALADIQHSLPALRRVTALPFPAAFSESGELDCFGIVETDSWLASHLGQTPTTLTCERSGIVFLADDGSEAVIQ